MMKKILLLVTLITLIESMPQAHSIAFIPPIIYIATISIGSLITNIFIFLAFWLTVKGITDRSYFGKPFHELVSMTFSMISKTATFVFSALAPVMILNPLNTEEIIASSIISGAICATILFLNSFRKYRLTGKDEKTSILRSIAIITSATMIVTFVSTSLALETKILHTNDRYGTEYEETQPSLIAIPDISEYKSMADTSGISKSMEKAAESTKSETSPPNLKKTLWFYPTDPSSCIISFKDRELLKVAPSKNCYYYNTANKKETIYCPIPITTEALKQAQTSGTISGTGSCKEQYSVRIEQEGFYLDNGND